MSPLTDRIEEQRRALLGNYANAITQRQQTIEAKASKRGVIAQVTGGGAWVDILTEDGGGKAFVTIETGRAYAERQAITVAGDRGYF
jgi:hypothetical protein